MPVAGDDLVCPEFQPNIFDPSRCHDCLRQKRLHVGAGANEVGTATAASPAAVPQPSPPVPGTGRALAPPGAPLLSLPGQTGERDTSNKVGERERYWRGE